MKKGLGLLTPLFLMACSQQVTISKDTVSYTHLTLPTT